MLIELTKERMLRVLTALDHQLPAKVTLIVGGGSAMILAYAYPLATSDIDAVPKGMEIHELDHYVKLVSRV